jgi:ABC-type multidrug transport system fused ATPase/permease subunit
MFTSIFKFYLILNSNQKKNFIFLTALTLFSAIFEMLSLGILIPIMSLLTNQSEHFSVFGLDFLHSLLLTFNLTDNQKIIYFLIILLLIFFVKTIFFTFLNFFNFKIIANFNYEISKKVFRNYLLRDYNFFLSSNSSGLTQKLTKEIENLVEIFSVSLLLLFNEIFILVAISLVLIFLNFKAYIVAFLFFGLSSLVFFLLIKNFLNKWSLLRQVYQTKIIKCIQEGIRNIKELKIFSKENEFINYFNFYSLEYSKIQSNVNFLSSIPRHYIELIAIIFFVFGMYAFLFTGVSNAQIIITLSIFVAAMLKILPSINRIINCIIKLKYAQSSVDVIYNELNLINGSYYFNINKIDSKKKLIIKKNIKVNNVFFKYENNKNFILKNVNFKFPANKIIGFFGKSGSGKTTLIDLLIGLLTPTKGNIYVDGKDIAKNLRKWKNNIGYVQQSIYLIDSSIKANIVLGLKEDSINLKKINDILNIVCLKDFVDNLPNKINTNVGELGNNLSGGQRQRIGIARALYFDRDVLILDEATNSLDQSTEQKVIENICKLKNKTIIFVTHKKSLLKYCDIIFDLNKLKNKN